jgi:hypothetical protein
MKIESKDLPPILRENDNFYLEWVKTSVTHADPEATVTVRQNSEGLVFSVLPSVDILRQSLIDNLLESHRRLNLKIKFSSSLKIQKSISFTIQFDKIR